LRNDSNFLDDIFNKTHKQIRIKINKNKSKDDNSISSAIGYMQLLEDKVFPAMKHTLGHQMLGVGGSDTLVFCSPECKPCDFFLLGYMKEKVYQPLPKNMAALKMKVRVEFAKITEVHHEH
jgi:hypothetical protein